MFGDANEIAPLFGEESKSLVTTDLYSDSTSEKTFETSLGKLIVQHAAQLAKGAAIMEDGKDKSIVVALEASQGNEDSYVAVSVDKASSAFDWRNEHCRF